MNDLDSAKRKKRISNPEQGYLKARGYCAYQERSQQEVRSKLYEWGLNEASIEEILVKLIESNFLNEERFACAYAGGKFRIKKWGKNKIRQALKLKGVSEYCIKKGLAVIDADNYLVTLREILKQRAAAIKEKNPAKANYKLAQYAQSRGFESSLIWDELRMEE